MKYLKGQAAMEFLMTYGWALLVVLAAIGALAYFGVLNPQQFMPEQCVLIPGLTCVDFKVTPSDVTVLLSNSFGKDIQITRVTTGNCSQDFTQNLDNGDQVEFVLFGCDNGKIGAKFKEDLDVEYTTADSGFAKTARGSISAKVQ